jgi:sulfite exporter TauE/SafE
MICGADDQLAHCFGLCSGLILGNDQYRKQNAKNDNYINIFGI